MGTPTPEPPDTLPRPDGGLIFGARELATAVDSAGLAPFDGPLDSVPANAELWVVNLDRPGSEPITVFAQANGSFETRVPGEAGDRIRLVTRTDTQHSLPLDGQITRDPVSNGSSITALPPTALSCLDVAPEDLTAVVDGADVTRRFTLTSTCDEPVSLDARLRFGDTGFAVTAPETVPANGRAELTVRITNHDDPREHPDIVLLDVASGPNTGRYALGVWSVAASSR